MNFPIAPQPKMKRTPFVWLNSLAIVLLSLFASFLLVHPAHGETTSASGAEEITTLPATITQPGTYYLKQNFQVNMTGGDVLLINASDVTVDLNGHTISNLAAGPPVTARAIHAYNRENITIRNGKISGFHRGINLESDPVTNSTLSSGHLVEDIYVTRCNFLGITICGGNGTIRRCRFSKIGGTSTNNGIWPSAIIVAGPNQRVLDCDIGEGLANAWGGGSTGILCHTTTDAILEGNRISQVTHAIAYLSTATFKYRDTLTGTMVVPYWVGSGGIDAGGNN
jgi:hypothetical protein